MMMKKTKILKVLQMQDLFFTKKHREKPNNWKQLTAKNVIIDREQEQWEKRRGIVLYMP